MNQELVFLVYAVLIGMGATVVMDLWALLLKRCFGIPSLNYAMVGRWIGHLPRGRFIHESIARTTPIRAEGAIGWAAHYGIGMIFAAVLLAVVGLDWARQPTVLAALIFGALSVAAPFFILQPGMGAGLAASKTPQPNTLRLRSLMAHMSFGVGLYVAAWVIARLFHF